MLFGVVQGSVVVKVFGCRPMMTAPRTRGPAYANLHKSGNSTFFTPTGRRPARYRPKSLPLKQTEDFPCARRDLGLDRCIRQPHNCKVPLAIAYLIIWNVVMALEEI